MKKQIKLLALLAAGVAMGSTAEAQITYPYVVTFENATKPSPGWAADTLVDNGGRWYASQALIGSDANDIKIATKSLRMRPEVGNSFTLLTDMDLGIDTFQMRIGRSNFSQDRTATAPLVEISYSTNQGTSWVVADTINLDGVDTLMMYTNKLNLTAPARVKITAVAGTSTRRFNIDNIYITAAAQATNLVLVSKTPTGNIHPSANTISFKLNEDLVAGTGNLTVTKVGGSDQVIAATAANVTINNDVVSISGITLDPSSSYFVKFDSTFVEGATSALKPEGIYNNTDWTFATTALSLQSFVEPFTNCNGTELGIFTSKSVLGTAEFFCDTYNDTLNSFNPPYVSINAGSGAASFANEDYLVTSLPIDLTGIQNIKKVNLKYDEKRRFGGNEVTRGIFYSTDYAGDAATATWVAIDADLEAIASTGSFFPRNKEITADVAALTQPFYLAFKYSSLENPDSSKAWQWSLDNIALSYETTTGINNVNYNGLTVTVLGEATPNEINIRVAANKAQNMTVRLFDIAGRQVYSQEGNFVAGTQMFAIKGANINSGMYVARFETSEGSKSVKVMVK